MGGFFGVVSADDCVSDLFYGTDYHSHLGTEFGGIATMEGEKFFRQIHGIALSTAAHLATAACYAASGAALGLRLLQCGRAELSHESVERFLSPTARIAEGLVEFTPA